MTKENICKFVSDNKDGSLRVQNFVCENKAPDGNVFTFRAAHMMCLVSAGNGTLYTETARYELVPGHLFFTFASVPFRIVGDGNLVYLYITFDGSRAEDLFTRFGISPSSCCFAGYEGLLPLWQDRLVRANGQNLDLMTESVLLYSFAKLRDVTNDLKATVDQVLKYVEENYRDPDLSLSQVAQKLGYNPKYLSHLLKTKLQRGFSDYVTTVRIHHAVFLIGQGVTSVKNLAILCGYADPLYFSKVFRRIVGLSPRDYIAGL